MKHKYLSIFAAVMAVLLCIPLSACGAVQTEQTETVLETIQVSGDIKTISVAVYPYIPDVALFQEILAQKWEEIEPDIELNFVEWDCYSNPDPGEIDVVMYDSLVTSYLAENGYIQPIVREDVENLDDILPFAMEGATYAGDIYGIPNLVCSYFLFYYSDDVALLGVENFPELYSILLERKDIDQNSDEKNAGLTVNFADTYPYQYLDALIDISGEYMAFQEAPDWELPDKQAMEVLLQIKELQTITPEGMENLHKAALFNAGHGSAYYGYPEDLFHMPDIYETLEISTISFSDNMNIQMYFADLVSLSSHVTDEVKKEQCIKLMNLMGSEDFLTALCVGKDTVQYLLPARTSVYEIVAKEYSIYERLQELVMDEQNRVYRFGVDLYDYFAAAYGMPPQ